MIRLRIMTESFTREEEADAVFLPGEYCPFEVLPGHAPMISALSAGSLRWRRGSAVETLPVKGGVVRIKSDEIDICVQI